MTSWLPLPYDEWRETRDTLHMYTQVIGKLRLALSPFEPQWANVPLYVTARGLTTSPMPVGLETLEGEFDFFANVLVLRSSDGRIERRVLGGSVAAFYGDVMTALTRLGVRVELHPYLPRCLTPSPVPEDRTHHRYDAAQALRFWRVLARVDSVLREHRAGFFGKTRRSRSSGAPSTSRSSASLAAGWTRALMPGRSSGSPRPPSGSAAGGGPGTRAIRNRLSTPTRTPKPVGLEQAAIRPTGAAWNTTIGEFLLPYAVAQASADPRAAILEFLHRTYDAGAGLLGWPSDLTQVEVPGRPRAKVP